MVGGLVILAIGLFLMSFLRADTPNLVLWGWMFVAGFGVGPTFAVFTIIVQNAVPFSELGAATSDLTLFRQIGTTMGLTLAFTFFRENLTWTLLHDQIVAAGAPAAVVPSTPPAGLRPEHADLGHEHGQPAGVHQPAAGPAPGDLHPGLPPGLHDRDRELDAPRAWALPSASVVVSLFVQ